MDSLWLTRDCVLPLAAEISNSVHTDKTERAPHTTGESPRINGACSYHFYVIIVRRNSNSTIKIASRSIKLYRGKIGPADLMDVIKRNRVCRIGLAALTQAVILNVGNANVRGACLPDKR